jgi:phosphatidylinositol alpha-1,6-mannosyltransferase
MELQSWEITSRMERRRAARVLALRRGQLWLPLFLLATMGRVLAGALRGSIAVLHLGDAVLAPVGALGHLLGVPVCATVHGLDVTHPNRLYQLWLRLFFLQLDSYVCVSGAARNAAVALGVPRARITVCGGGVTIPDAPGHVTARDPNLLLFIGRLVPRKGLGWFVGAVLPSLAARNPLLRLAVIGTGTEREAVESAAAGNGVGDRIIWLGAVSDVDKWQWLARASVCVMPNVEVPGDIEGYGITALEAAAAACPLVVADLEGLREAIVDGEGGRVVASANPTAWVDALQAFLDRPEEARAVGERAREWVRTHRSWEAVCDRYEQAFEAIAHPRSQ